MAIDPMTAAALASTVAGLFRRPRKNPALIRAQEFAMQEASRAGQEEEGLSARAMGADAQAEQAYNTRLSELDRGLSPEWRAATLNRVLAPAQASYQRGVSRLNDRMAARGLTGSSVAAGASAALENGRVAAEGAAGGQVALLDQQQRERNQREKLGLVESWRSGLDARFARARARRLAAQNQGVGAQSAAWAQDRQDDAAQGQNFGMAAETLAELLQGTGRKKIPKFGGVPEASQGPDGEFYLG